MVDVIFLFIRNGRDSMADLTHGGDIYSAREKGARNIIDFSANINPLGLPARVKEAIIQGLDTCVHYPDPLCRELTAAIADFEQVPTDFILCGNGAADIIFRMTLACKPKKALVLAPTFAEYETALESVGCQVTHYFLEEQKNFRLDEGFIASLTADIEMVFLCNPNNPTGQLMEKTLLEQIARTCEEKNIWLVIDECFMDFVHQYDQYSMKDTLAQYKNMMILKAFTKNFAMPGIRLGYGMTGNSHLHHQLSAVGQPWSVSIPAQLAGVQALKEKDYIEKSFQSLTQEKEYLVSELNKLRIKYYAPAANYILLNLRDIEKEHENFDFKEALFKQDILIRDCSNYEGLEKGYYRIAIKSHEDNEKLIHILNSMQLNI